MVPPVREMDPADAKDLEEFMEAEKRRREECGDEEEVSEMTKSLTKTGDVDIDDTGASTGIAVVLPPTSHRAEVRDSDDELDNGTLSMNPISFVLWRRRKTRGYKKYWTPIHISSTFFQFQRYDPNIKEDFRSKKTPDTTPHFVVQLQTPPQSRTPFRCCPRRTNFLFPLLPLLLPLSSFTAILPHKATPRTKTHRSCCQCITGSDAISIPREIPSPSRGQHPRTITYYVSSRSRCFQAIGTIFCCQS
ncbi:hypothetical protein B0H13DRAFT_774420 [Mycena leptocephala]|nr:hypothetical protein B0H13DRAFT_774420 [Mycena leptocephala]